MTKELGFYGLDIPEEYGGPGIDLVTRTLMAFEMAQHRAGLYAPCYGVFGGAGLAQLYEADDHQKERYLYPVLRGEKRGFFALTEPSGGSDPARAIRTTAVRDGDDWIIDGEKTFISGADKADFGIVFARTDPELGRNARGSPASWSTRTCRVSASAASSTPCVRRTTPRNSSSTGCGCRAATCWAR